MKTTTRLLVLACALVTTSASADDLHPAMQSKFQLAVGGFFSARDFRASAGGTAGDILVPDIDFETAVGLKDAPELLIAGFGWRFTEKWHVDLQYFSSSRGSRTILQDTVEWQGLTYDAGADISASSKFDITRLVFSRDFWENGPHSLRLAGGLHYLDIDLAVSGVATLDDQSREFRRSVASASLPIPNVGAWYRYSPSRRWLFAARMDWFSANLGDYSGLILNTAASAKFAFNDYFSVGLAYEYFKVDGELRASNWKGNLKSSFDGPILGITAHW